MFNMFEVFALVLYTKFGIQNIEIQFNILSGRRGCRRLLPAMVL